MIDVLCRLQQKANNGLKKKRSIYTKNTNGFVICNPLSRDIRKADGGFAADMYTRREDEKFFIIIQGIDNSPDWNQIANKWNSQSKASLPLEREFETVLS